MYTILELVNITGLPYGTVWNHMKRGFCKWPQRQVKGQSNDPAYKCWEGMIQRCTNPNSPKWSEYGGRGIKVDPSFISFKKFKEAIGDRPSMQHSIDRIDPYGNYTPDNIRWATSEIQQSNKRLPKRQNEFGIEKHGKKYRFIYKGKKMIYSSFEEAKEEKIRLYNYKGYW